MNRFVGFAKLLLLRSFDAGSLESDSDAGISSLSHLRNGLLVWANGFVPLPFSDDEELPFCSDFFKLVFAGRSKNRDARIF